MKTHSLFRQKYSLIFQLDFSVTHFGQGLFKRVFIRQGRVVAIKIPKLLNGFQAYIQSTISLFGPVESLLDNSKDFGRYGYWPKACRSIDFRNLRTGDTGAHQFFHPLNFVEGFLNGKLGDVFIFFKNGNFDKGSHQKLGPAVNKGFRFSTSGDEDSQTEQDS